MVKWQKRARVGLGLFGAAFAIVVYAAMGERRSATPLERPSRLDPRAILESAGAAFQQFREARLKDPKLLGFIERISARVDPEIEAMGAAFRHAARIAVTTRDGRVLKAEMLNRRGSAENPLTPGDIERKFREVVRSCLDGRHTERVIAIVQDLEKMETVDELIRIMGAPTHR